MGSCAGTGKTKSAKTSALFESINSVPAQELKELKKEITFNLTEFSCT
jgi:hypothetical protein